jgi:transposase InsO family protein
MIAPPIGELWIHYSAFRLPWTFYIINYIDVFTRELVGSYADYSINSKKAVRALDKAIKDRGIDPLGLILRSDNGSQYISENFAEYCKIKGIYHEFTHVRCPEENGHIEAYHGILEEELLSRSEFDSLEEARAALLDWEFFLKAVVYPHGRMPLLARCLFVLYKPFVNRWLVGIRLWAKTLF